MLHRFIFRNDYYDYYDDYYYYYSKHQCGLNFYVVFNSTHSDGQGYAVEMGGASNCPSVPNDKKKINRNFTFFFYFIDAPQCRLFDTWPNFLSQKFFFFFKLNRFVKLMKR
jgi:hypothetical protein